MKAQAGEGIVQALTAIFPFSWLLMTPKGRGACNIVLLKGSNCLSLADKLWLELNCQLKIPDYSGTVIRGSEDT